ncbi:uncharacterized protein [Clytia hemisphaerica]|uniref:VWFA domain-containing protein n=1 Tax=Clytia hemisphaerica TaxID=252671 RepID=A0A7M5WS21_9CNID
MGVQNIVFFCAVLYSVVLLVVKTENIQDLGCWKDNNVKRALPILENNHPLLSDSYKKRTNPIIKCAQVANHKGFHIFALQNGGQCFGGPKGEKTFEMYGPSNLCRGGKGGHWSNNVYSTQTFYRRTVHQQPDPSPWDPYCSRDLDMVILLDGSGSRSNKGNKRRWNDMLDFTQKFVKGFDTHARIGIVEYSNDVKIPIDMLKAAPPEKIVDLVKSIEMPGGRRSLNDALKTAWRDQLKESNRSSADRVIVAMTTGNVPYGLYGSSQFLSDHLVRVVAVGVDRDVNYEFLQSVASYRDVKNIFSVNHEQLGDIAPYIYRDICNTFPDYVSEQTTTTRAPPATTLPPATPAPQQNAQQQPSSENNATTNQNNSTVPNSAPQNAPVNNTKAAGRGDIISIPLSALSGLPLQLLSQKKDELPTPSSSESREKKTDVVTVLDPKNPKEHLASMVLINPKPELNLDLTKEEVSEINNRRHHQEDDPTESLSDALEKYKKLVKEGYADDMEVKNETSTHHEKVGEEKGFTSSQDEFYGANEREENQHALPHKEKEKEHEIEFKTSKDEKFRHEEEAKEHSVNFHPDEKEDNGKFQHGESQGSKGYHHEGESKENSKEEDIGEKDEASKLMDKEEKNEEKIEKMEKEESEGKKEQNKKGKKEGKNYKVEASKFKPKFIPQTKSESPKPSPTEGQHHEDGLKTVSDEKSSSKPGELEQTVEYHSGNGGSEHVSQHPHHKIDYQNMFQGKLKDKAKNEFFNERIFHQNEHTEDERPSSHTKHTLWDSSTLSPLKKEGFLTEDLGLTPIRDQYESAAIFGNESPTSPVTTKTTVPQQSGKIMNLLGEIEQAAQQTAQMAKHELKKLDEGDQDNVPVASKRVLEVKSKKIDSLLNSLDGEESQQFMSGNPKLGLEAMQLQDVIQTLQNMFKPSTSEQSNPSERRQTDEQHKEKSLLDFHPIKIAKSQIATTVKTMKKQKYQSFLKSFEEHLKDITSSKLMKGLQQKQEITSSKLMKGLQQKQEITSSKRTEGLQQKHEIDHLYHIKASDNVTSFPFNLPFATNHHPNPIIPNPKIGLTHPFRDASVAHYSPWLHPANNFPLNHGPPDIQLSDLQVQNILLQPDPIIGPSRSNTNQKPSLATSTSSTETQTQVQPREKVLTKQQPFTSASFQQREKVPSTNTKQSNTGDQTQPAPKETFQQRENVPQSIDEPDYSDIGGEVPREGVTDGFSPFGDDLSHHGFAPIGHADPSIARQQGFGNFPPVNDVSDLPTQSMIEQQPISGDVGPKNPVLMVSSSGNVAPSHNEVIDKNVHAPKTEGGKFAHLNLNTLTRKTHTPIVMATPRPPSLPEIPPMRQFSSMVPFGHLKPLRARPDIKRRPLMKDHKSKDATRLIKHVKKKNEIKQRPTSKRQTPPKSKPSTKQKHTPTSNKKPTKTKKRGKKATRAKTRSTPSRTKLSTKSNINSTKIQTFNTSNHTSTKLPKTNQTVKNNSALIKPENSTNTKLDPTTTHQNTTTTTTTSKNVNETRSHANTTSPSKKSIDYNKPLSIYSHGRSIHFKTSPEVSEVLMNGIVQKKGVIDSRVKDTKRENDFPMIFNIADFNLNDLPMLTKGRSYVLTSNEKGRVTVSVNNNNEKKKSLSTKTTTSKTIAQPKKPTSNTTAATHSKTRTTTTDHLSELEVEKNKLDQSLAGLKILKNSTSTMSYEEPLSNTEDRVVTHDFTDIKDMKDRTKTVSEMLKTNPLLKIDASSKHGTIPPSNSTLKNETSKASLTNNKTSSANQTSHVLESSNQKNITSLSANQNNVTSSATNQTKASDKLMAYIKGMSKFEDDTDNDFEILSTEPNKKDGSSKLNFSSKSNNTNDISPKETQSLHNETSVVNLNVTKTENESRETKNESRETKNESQETKNESRETENESRETKNESRETKNESRETKNESRETMEESRQTEQEEEPAQPTPKHHGFVSLLKASQNIQQHQNEAVTMVTEQRNKTAESEEELRQKIMNEQKKPILETLKPLHDKEEKELFLKEGNITSQGMNEQLAKHEVRTTNKTTKAINTNATKTVDSPVTKQTSLLANKNKKNITDVSPKFKETSSDVLTFQMQNTTYKVFDSNPSSVSQTKSRPEPSKVEKASYETATGVESKPTPVKQIRPIGLKTPTKVEKQAYNATLNKHQTAKRKLLMNISLADAMEKMNPTPRVSERKANIRSNTTVITPASPSSVSDGRNTLQHHLNADPGSILGCSKPLRLLYVIDVSEGMGRGTQRLRRWSRLKDFIQNINVNLLKGVEHEYMVYNIEPRIIDGLDKCDRTTELFTIADDCLCNKKYHITSDGNGCSVNQPVLRENMDDWGKVGPRAGKALQRAKEMYFSKEKEKYKNVILLLSHKQSADDIERIERDLKASGISLIDIELGQRHDLRRKSVIPHPPGYVKVRRSKRSVFVPTHSSQTVAVVNKYGKTLLRRYSVMNNNKRNVITPRKRSFIPGVKHSELKTKRASVKRKSHKKEEIEILRKQTISVEPLRRRNNIPRSHIINKTQAGTKKSIDSSVDDTHKVKVSLKKLTQTLKDIIGKVCTSNSDEELNMKKRSLMSENFY